jgi:hypothetical protein
MISAFQLSGFHSIEFDASNLSSGIYFYRMTARSSNGGTVFSDVRKMMIIK